MLGKIHSIESFSTVDGPGVRFVVFMQGCKLRCKFCHNPDTWKQDSGTIISDEELVQKILKAKKYLTNGKGGVTFSGGEPLLQTQFLISVCKRLKKENIHIAIDTAGNFDFTDEKINELINYVDLFLYDIKHINSKRHEWLTGVRNEKILKMEEYLSNEKGKKMWIRIVYIPGITDEADSLEKYKKFICTLKSVEKIEILPYHEMGKYKWKELGMKYLLDAKVPSNEQTEYVRNYFKDTGKIC